MATGSAQRVSERVRAASEEAALRIVDTLRDTGYTAYLAGGCVRDLLLGLSPTDYDVATSATPEQVLELFDDAHAVGKAFGVILVRFGKGRLSRIAGRPSPPVAVEVATFRREGGYSDKRRPDSVQFCGPDEDARRRDFTLNALFLDPRKSGPVEQRVIDTVGGVSDLRSGLIRAVGDPAARLNEDHLRALRAVRFAARLGFEIELGTARAIREHARALTGVSEERVGDELRRMLGRHMPVTSRLRAIDLLETLELADPVLGRPDGRPDGPDEAPLTRRALAAIDAQATFPTVLAAWVHDREGLFGCDARQASERLLGMAGTLRRVLVLTNEEDAAFRDIAEGFADLETTWADAGIARKKRMASSGWFEGAIRLLEGRDSGLAGDIFEERDRLAGDPIGLRPIAWITGEDLIAAGLHPGPSFRERLDRAYDAQLDGSAQTASDALRIALAED